MAPEHLLPRYVPHRKASRLSSWQSKGKNGRGKKDLNLRPKPDSKHLRNLSNSAALRRLKINFSFAVGSGPVAARKYGLKFGVYLSPWNRHEPRYGDAQEYDKYYAAELDELAQNYGELAEFWLDGAGSATWRISAEMND